MLETIFSNVNGIWNKQIVMKLKLLISGYLNLTFSE